ncbi:MAG: S41 family peptidase, partial [Candidatus Eisenbacteria bacterium]
LLCAMLVPARAHGEPAAGFPVDTLLATLRTRSVHRHHVNWEAAAAELRTRVAGASDDESCARAVVALFERMGDVHSVFTHAGRSYSHYDALPDTVRARLLPMLDREREQAGRVESSWLTGDHAYVRVPSMDAWTPEQVQALTEQLYAQVNRLAAQKPRGWLIDLRLNGGGNLYPMLAGLAPVLGTGVVGGTVDADGREVQSWVLKPDGLYWRDAGGDRRFAGLDPVMRERRVPLPAAVLVGPVTRSSGQAVAMAFRGRARTVLIGEPTARGYTTVTAPFVLGERTTLLLAVGSMRDRRGDVHESELLPDVNVYGGDDFESPLQDRKVRAALEWLRHQGGR